MSDANTVVVYVHGLWLTGGESLLLRQRLKEQFGFDVRPFHYPTVSAPMQDITRRLRSFVDALGAQRLHFVGHSLGGLVLYRFLERYPRQPPGRVVFLGTPCVSCRAARHASRVPLLGALIGKAVAEELLCDHERRWVLDRELGIIAGSRPLGLGRFFARFEEDCDGTVAVSETRLPGAADHLTLPVSHMGMLASRSVAQQTGRFLATGGFSLTQGAAATPGARRAAS